jgi:hypothetical protein
VEALLNQRIKPRDRLVENQQLGLVHERLDEAELLAVTRRQLAYSPVEVGIEALCKLFAKPPVDTTPQVRQVVEHRRSAQHRVERELAWQEADPTSDLEAVRPTVQPKQRRRPRGRPDEVEQQPHRCRLSRAVRTEEPQNLAALDFQVEPEEPMPATEVLRQARGPDRDVAGHDLRL